MEPHKKIKIIRESLGISQRKLSQLSGVRQATISAFENGKVDIQVSTLTAISEALNCDIHISLFAKSDT